ncbi:hypothetical protein PoB_006506300 [Plakobranchus ocellatus]|uniref:Uncharacterized protein n=1 Tax=Plakobranchus ocellatus TaxID=259542 RepID=A0AAV4D3E8_9GAST|nr:hypothetical protein PoB_006506300 [Plakobranchus ocellatus]
MKGQMKINSKPQWTPQTKLSWLSPQQGDLRLSGPLSGRNARGGARTRDRGIPADLRADSLATVPPTLRFVSGGSKLKFVYADWFSPTVLINFLLSFSASDDQDAYDDVELNGNVDFGNADDCESCWF